MSDEDYEQRGWKKMDPSKGPYRVVLLFCPDEEGYEKILEEALNHWSESGYELHTININEDGFFSERSKTSGRARRQWRYHLILRERR
jgi:hypothetical protein